MDGGGESGGQGCRVLMVTVIVTPYVSVFPVVSVAPAVTDGSATCVLSELIRALWNVLSKVRTTLSILAECNTFGYCRSGKIDTISLV